MKGADKQKKFAVAFGASAAKANRAVAAVARAVDAAWPSCEECGGSGFFDSHFKCPRCGGSGKEPSDAER